MQTLSTLWSASRDDLRARHALREDARRLERELAAYSSPADRAELDAILARHPDSDVAPIESILSRQRAA